ncbi:YopX protein [Ruminiclostridium papyrosolvens DSM 2782]|uniref:YopX protein n=1 Tax=Ruminiclostridium papyrosolvens DSM 2782 TaxID=588581 RepID=F1TEF6_9FIRM|nr:YopX family protein [Ruminiclostridium papyrosolvens]EGD47122.1 YopX protein [Ruminiclostridium papyrosolvens DSM 2782]WES36064.1 YopX family protein [Ruminiclostridium papyrosolvens DSM 2782]WES36162.1 YopX family protein [Ruminiclostridium papyrosolvens DSM 2782]
MRKHKFRGKRVDTGEWVYGCYIKVTPYKDSDGHRICTQDTWLIIPVIPETVGQYIETINGHEIYHHDIVKAYKYGDTETSPFIYDITYRNGTWWFGNWTWIEFLQSFRCVEVIGNIHDNPEMMEVPHE